MNTLKKITFLLACGMSATVSAIPIPYGWYLDGNVGNPKTHDAAYSSNKTLSVNSNLYGWNLNGGYKFTPYFGAEVGYTEYGDADIKFNSVKFARDKRYAIDIAGRGIIPVYDLGFDLFGKLGISRLNSDVSITNQTVVDTNGITLNTGRRGKTGVYFGVGADYFFLHNLGVTAQWMKAKGDNNAGNSELLSVGVNCIFG